MEFPKTMSGFPNTPYSLLKGGYTLARKLPGNEVRTTYSPPWVDRIWGICGSDYYVPKAIFYLLKGGYRLSLEIPTPF